MNLMWRPQAHLATSINGQMIQSIKLLQFDREELDAFLAEQAERNPLIDVQMPVAAARTSAAPDATAADLRRMQSSGGGKASSAGAAGAAFMQENIGRAPTLREHLRRQLAHVVRVRQDMRIAEELVESIDEDGYLRRDTGLIADALDVELEDVHVVLNVIHTLDPPGVGARSVAECLRLQLADQDRLSPEMKQLLDHLPLLAAHDYRQLAARCGVILEAAGAMAKQIPALDPRPSLRFDHEPVAPALPDVHVSIAADGTFTTAMNSELLPRVLVNRQYYSQIRGGCRGSDEVRFVADCLKSANSLVRNLEQRAQTILKVATEIVARQKDFLRFGVAFLKPMTLKDVADAVGVHQSTVCRAINNKYIMTPRGQFDLKFFFATSVSAKDGGEGVASDTVRHRIKRLIDQETAAEVLSDDAIVKTLRAEGVELARRTVAKYRGQLKIPSSASRKRQRDMAAAVGAEART